MQPPPQGSSGANKPPLGSQPRPLDAAELAMRRYFLDPIAMDLYRTVARGGHGLLVAGDEATSAPTSQGLDEGGGGKSEAERAACAGTWHGLDEITRDIWREAAHRAVMRVLEAVSGPPEVRDLPLSALVYQAFSTTPTTPATLSAVPPSEVFARVALNGRQDLGLCRVREGALFGMTLLEVTPLDAYPWCPRHVSRSSIFSLEMVSKAEAVDLARRTKGLAMEKQAQEQAGLREKEARHAARKGLLAEILPHDQRQIAVRVFSAGELVKPLELLDLEEAIVGLDKGSYGGAIGRSFGRSHWGIFFHNSALSQTGTLVLSVDKAHTRIVAEALFSIGFGHVRTPLGTFDAMPLDASDPFAGEDEAPTETHEEDIPF